MTRLPRKTAKPGDICILLFPTATELRVLRQQQAVLQAQYGGRIIIFSQITALNAFEILGRVEFSTDRETQ
jgi:hypothetical protein